MARGGPSRPKSASVRLMPAAMATVAVVLGVKALSMAESMAETDAAPTPPAQASPPRQAAPVLDQCVPPTFAEMAGLSPAEVQVLQALSARRQVLDQRADEVETQDALVLAAERRLDERLAELRRLEANVNDLLGRLDEAQEQRMTSLVDVYQRMRAKDAAEVFDGLEDGVLVQVASRMRQASLAEVMGRMDPERARRLTQMLAERARPPADAQDLMSRSAPASAR
jgi:flagellar motility protein MotE (MotC chaperone)